MGEQEPEELMPEDDVLGSDEQPEEEQEADAGLRRRSSRRSSSSSKRRSSKRASSAKSAAAAAGTVKEESDLVDAKVVDAARYLRNIAAVGLLVALLVDWLLMGFRAGSTGFIDWWDLVGTVAYVRSRRSIYALRKKENQTSVAWAGYVLLNSFVLYEIAGKVARTIMRRTPVLPSVGGFMDFVVYGFLPVHFAMGDRLYDGVQNNDIQQLLVSAYWATTKTRSVVGQITEAVTVHHWGPAPCLALCLLSCEIASVVSRIDQNVNLYTPQEWVQRWPGGMKAWLTSRTFMSSLFISLFTYLTVRTMSAGVWPIFIGLTLLSCFYRYSNGLLERSIDKYILAPRVGSVAEREEAEGAEDEAVSSSKPLSLDALQLKNVRRALEQLEARVQGYAHEVPEVLQAKAAAAPAAMLAESKTAAEAVALVLQQLERDTFNDVEALTRRVEEIQAELEANAKGFGEEVSEFGRSVSKKARKVKIR